MRRPLRPSSDRQARLLLLGRSGFLPGGGPGQVDGSGSGQSGLEGRTLDAGAGAGWHDPLFTAAPRRHERSPAGSNDSLLGEPRLATAGRLVHSCGRKAVEIPTASPQQRGHQDQHQPKRGHAAGVTVDSGKPSHVLSIGLWFCRAIGSCSRRLPLGCDCAPRRGCSGLRRASMTERGRSRGQHRSSRRGPTPA